MQKHAKPVVAETEKTVALHVEYGLPNFKWQMAFNAYSLEKVSHGCLIRFAYCTRQGEQTFTPEIVPLIVSFEGLEQMKATLKAYIGSFGDVPVREPDLLPSARQFSPLFSNHVRLSYAGHTGEVAFFTVPLHDLANASKGILPPNYKVPAVQVALMHSEITVHRQLVLDLMNF